MSSEELALTVDNLSKCYHIYEKPVDHLKQMVSSCLGKTLSKTKPKRYFTEHWALNDVSFSIKKGETTGIIGVNGAGKSTLLQLICGTLTPTSGRVNVNGRVAALLELGSGFNMEFTGIENVYLYGAILGLTQMEMDNRLTDICEFADIGDYVYQPLKTYSSGMIIRLAFSVIVHVDADILVIDEALSVGDAFFVQKRMRFLRKFMEKGTVLFVSHDISAVINLCSHVMWLEEGRIKKQGTPKIVSERYLGNLVYVPQGADTDSRSREISNDSDSHRPGTKDSGEMRDMRLDYINRTNLRNDLEVFQFQPDSESFGYRKASIVNVRMTDEDDRVCSWIVGGERVVLIIECEAHETLSSPIVGFYVKDRLGQYLFGDNTYLTYVTDTPVIRSGSFFQARFRFQMPILPMGQYSIATAVAEGTQDDHRQQHWFHDALVFQSHSSAVVNGLVGIPMAAIELVVSDSQ